MPRSPESALDWPAIAEALAKRFPKTALHPAVVKWADAASVAGVENVVNGSAAVSSAGTSTPWAIAFSGGADSLAVLLLTWAHWPERRVSSGALKNKKDGAAIGTRIGSENSLIALHFNHRLRGRAAIADAKFCESVCASLGIKCVVGTWTGRRKSASEAEARAARFEFFQGELSQLNRPKFTARAATATPTAPRAFTVPLAALWFGHQQDDIAETQLMRLARGSGTAGLAALRPVQILKDEHVQGIQRVHLRPLLTLKKADLVSALTEVGAVWREDASNEAEDYTRNRIRHGVLQSWRTAAGENGRDALAGAALSRELLEEDDTALEAWTDTLTHFSETGALDLKPLIGKPTAVVRRALHRWLSLQADIGDLSRQGFATLLSAVEKGSFTRFSLGRAGFAVIRKQTLVFESKTPSKPSRAKGK